MAYLVCTASGSGVSGATIPKTGTVTFTFEQGDWTSSSYIRTGLSLYPIDSNGNELSYGSVPQDAGGSWSNRDNYVIHIDVDYPQYSTKSVSVNIDTFLAYYSAYPATAGLRLTAGIEYDTGYVGNEEYDFYFPRTSNVGAPTSPKVASTVSREAVELSWGAGSAGTNNSVTGYDVQYRESSDGSSWGSWTTASGSPVTGTKLSVSPSGTVGNYRQYRVRTRGSAGESWYSGWVTSANTLRRKWNAFGSWTDATLTAGVSGIRAVHLTQLQERVAVIRAFYGLAAYSFTTVTARKTKIAKWAALIQEIRSAVDGITASHESWNTLEAGKPRIAHITQLRKIIDGM